MPCVKLTREGAAGTKTGLLQIKIGTRTQVGTISQKHRHKGACAPTHTDPQRVNYRLEVELSVSLWCWAELESK